VSIRQYGIAAEKMNELGKCIGGLLASSAHRSQTGATGTFFARGGGVVSLTGREEGGAARVPRCCFAVGIGTMARTRERSR
jgi:hypothetical protein